MSQSPALSVRAQPRPRVLLGIPTTAAPTPPSQLLASDGFARDGDLDGSFPDVGNDAKMSYVGPGVFANWTDSSVVDIPNPPGLEVGDLIVASVGFNHAGTITPPFDGAGIWFEAFQFKGTAEPIFFFADQLTGTNVASPDFDVDTLDAGFTVTGKISTEIVPAAPGARIVNVWSGSQTNRKTQLFMRDDSSLRFQVQTTSGGVSLTTGPVDLTGDGLTFTATYTPGGALTFSVEGQPPLTNPGPLDPLETSTLPLTVASRADLGESGTGWLGTIEDLVLTPTVGSPIRLDGDDVGTSGPLDGVSWTEGAGGHTWDASGAVSLPVPEAGTCGMWWRLWDGNPTSTRWSIDNGVTHAGGVKLAYRPDVGFVVDVLDTSTNGRETLDSATPPLWAGVVDNAAHPFDLVLGMSSIVQQPSNITAPNGWFNRVEIATLQPIDTAGNEGPAPAAGTQVFMGVVEDRTPQFATIPDWLFSAAVDSTGGIFQARATLPVGPGPWAVTGGRDWETFEADGGITFASPGAWASSYNWRTAAPEDVPESGEVYYRATGLDGLRFHKFDWDGVDQSANWDRVAVGWTASALGGGQSFTITDVTDAGTYVQIDGAIVDQPDGPDRWLFAPPPSAGVSIADLRATTVNHRSVSFWRRDFGRVDRFPPGLGIFGRGSDVDNLFALVCSGVDAWELRRRDAGVETIVATQVVPDSTEELDVELGLSFDDLPGGLTILATVNGVVVFSTLAGTDLAAPGNLSGFYRDNDAPDLHTWGCRQVTLFDIIAPGVGLSMILDSDTQGILDQNILADALFDVIEVSERVRALSFDRGRETIIDNFHAGSCTIILDNRDGFLSPDQPNEDHRFGELIGAFVQIGTSPSGSSDSAPIDPIFTGRADNWVQAFALWADETVTLIAADALEEWSRFNGDAQAEQGEGDTVKDRLERIADLMAWDRALLESDVGQTLLQETTLAQPALQMALLAANSEGGWLFADKHGIIQFYSRSRSWTPEDVGPVWYISDDDDAVLPYDGMVIQYSAEKVRNDLFIAGAGLTQQRAVNEESVALYGRKTWSRNDLIMQNQDELVQLGATYLAYWSVPDIEFSPVSFSGGRGNWHEVFPALELRQGVTIVRKTAAQRIEKNALIEGIKIAWSPVAGWSGALVLSTISATLLSRFILDDPDAGILDQNALGVDSTDPPGT